MSIALAIKTDRSVYVAGHVLEGTVTVDVDKRRENGSPANDLELQIQGKVTTRVISPGDVNDPVGDPQECLFFQLNMVLASFHGMVKPGMHVIPFCVILPEGLPSTMMERCDDGGSVALSYHVKAKLDRPGLLRPDVKADATFSVAATRAPRDFQDTPQEMPLSVGPSTKIVKNVFGRSIGSITLATRLDSDSVRPGEAFGFTVVAQNDCSSNVLAMDLKITQLTTWVAHGRIGQKRRVIGSMLVPGHNLGELSKAVDRGNVAYTSVEDVTTSTEASVYARLISGTGSSILRFELSTPRKSMEPPCMAKNGSQLAYAPLRYNFMESLDLGDLVGPVDATVLQGRVGVTHALELRLKTPGGSSSPVWSVPLKVLPVAMPELLLLSLRSTQPLDTVPEVGHDMTDLSMSKLEELSDPESATSIDDSSSCSS